MSEVLEINRLVQSALLPPLEPVEDHTPLQYDQSQAKQIANFIGVLRSKAENFQISLDPHERDAEIIPLLLVCGENVQKAEWNTEQAVREATNLLSVICQKCGARDVKELMVSRLVSKLIGEIHSKLGKTCFKKFPAAIQCFCWIITNTKHPHIDDITGLILPVSLILVDDYELVNQGKGLQVIRHILNETTTSVLQHMGWVLVIFDALKPSCYRDVSEIVEVYICLNLCLKVMYSCPSNTIFWNKTDHYDTTFNQLLWNLEMEQSDGARCQYLRVLIDYIISMKIRCLRFLPAVSSLLNNYVTADCSVELCTKSLEVMEQILRHCWPCKDLDCMQDVLWVVFKGHHRGMTSSNSQDAANIRKSVERCVQTIELINLTDSATLRTMMETVT